MEENNAENEHEIPDELEEKYGIEAKFHITVTGIGYGKPLEKFDKIENPFPSEPKYMRKRETPKAIRYHKVKNTDLHKFYLHELMLYKSFDKKMYKRWCDSENACIDDYEKYKNDIKHVKSHMMEWMEQVEEARDMVANEQNLDDVEIDTQHEQDVADCDDDGTVSDDAYEFINPENLPNLPTGFPNSETDLIPPVRYVKLCDEKDLKLKTQKFDKWQRKVLDIGIKFATETVKANNPPNVRPKAPLVLVTGGAGSGKSTIIDVLTQWTTRILRKSGDDVESPYVIRYIFIRFIRPVYRYFEK